MIGHDYSRSNYDSCVYHKKLLDGTFVYLLLYFDDKLIVSKSIYEINKLKTLINNEFEMKNLRATKKILGIEIHGIRMLENYTYHRKKYIEKVLQRFGMQNAKPMSTPLATRFKLSAALSSQPTKEEEQMSHVPYASVVGSIMYVMVCTRPDISQAVSIVNRYMEILERCIDKLLNGYFHIEVLKILIWYFIRTTIHVAILLVILILTMSGIWIEEDLRLDMCSCFLEVQ